MDMKLNQRFKSTNSKKTYLNERKSVQFNCTNVYIQYY